MSRLHNWKVLGVAIGVALLAAVACLVDGNTGRATALFVVAVVEGLLWAVAIAFATAKRKTNKAIIS
jgi:ABC-type uncharacterized transport system permease subunit